MQLLTDIGLPPILLVTVRGGLTDSIVGGDAYGKTKLASLPAGDRELACFISKAR